MPTEHKRIQKVVFSEGFRHTWETLEKGANGPDRARGRRPAKAMRRGERRMQSRLMLALLLGALGTAAFLGACAKHEKVEPGEPQSKDSPAPPPTLTNGDARDASAKAIVDAAVPQGPMIGALFLSTPVMSDMEWPKDDEKKKPGDRTGSVRIGYIRRGMKVPVIPEAHPKSNCKEGWYELVQGGFVCGKYASLDMNHPLIRLAPHAPDMVGPLPYQYGYNVINGTPLYRHIPSREERTQLEPWLSNKKAKPKPKTDDTTAQVTDDLLDGGMNITLAKNLTASDPLGLGTDTLDAGTPWYLREYDGGKPQVTLDDLRGEGPVARRMVKGFFLALDKEITGGGAKWWKTTGSMLAPYNSVYVQTKISDFHGLWLNGENANVDASDAGPPRKEIVDLLKPGSKAQVGIITFYKSRKYIVAMSRKAVTTGDPVSRHTVVRLTGDTVSINGAEYSETDEGWWMKSSESTKTRPGDAPRDLAPGEKWIDVNLKTQTLVAYEGDKPVFATAVSTGKEDKVDEEKDHHTPPGTFRIREKHIAATMDGDVASDGPYSIEDVPWIMYFNGSYALHGAFWHNEFGRQKSHGCVNLAPLDAKALFAWTEPRLPDNWHGVMATPEKPGTRVIVHE